LLSVLWGAVSFVFVFFFVPTFMVGAPDIIWISICIVAPVIAAIIIFKKWNIRPLFVVAGMLIQFALLVLLNNRVARKWGMNLSGLGVFEYFSLFVYPVTIAVFSWVFIKFLNRNKR